ncbi:hypothetical protein T440DRAFT_523280 [Plenodomus tracheiphilus IPT5]|uniref:Uncharacterized protein n=1 Tax=Plenodomus tracheiphilus IPT5 TaxID=1408161 RepID=A0A6A7ANN1_9PLEO|nr:hypothetical protein T440DRAFT_523280 [Plenodomus tracheiphilus IPT5]
MNPEERTNEEIKVIINGIKSRITDMDQSITELQNSVDLTLASASDERASKQRANTEGSERARSLSPEIKRWVSKIAGLGSLSKGDPRIPHLKEVRSLEDQWLDLNEDVEREFTDINMHKYALHTHGLQHSIPGFQVRDKNKMKILKGRIGEVKTSLGADAGMWRA